MPSSNSRIVLWLALGVALVAIVALGFRWSHRLAVCRQQHESDLRSLALLREAVRQRDLQKGAAVEEEPAPAGDNRAALARRDASIAVLNQEVADARASVAELQVQLSNADDERRKAIAEADERSRRTQEDLQGRLDTLQKQLASAQEQSETSHERAAALESDNTRLRGDLSENTARAAELNRAASSLQDLDRRRDVYLTSITRQYRDITSQFRAMSGMLDSSRDQTSSAFSGAALTRIQNAISQADEDLRQLNDLNAQARQLEKKLMKK